MPKVSKYFGWINNLTNPIIIQHTVATIVGSGGSIEPAERQVPDGETTTFTVTPQTGYSHGAVGGTCPVGSFSGNTYTTGTITSNCLVNFRFNQKEGQALILPGVLMLLLDEND